MASKPCTSPGLLKLEEQLTCPVCLDLYTNPKTLPCLHSFCEACIEKLPQDKEGETYYLSCPTCRHRTELPGGGAGAFPVAFHINNLKEIYSLLKKVSDPQEVTCDNCTAANATGYCNDCNQLLCTECIGMHKKWARFASHQITSLDEVKSSPQAIASSKEEAPLICPIPSHDEPLKIYCETCDSVICRDCTVRTHKDHEYDLISASYTKHCEELKHSLNPVKKKIETFKKVLSALAEREGEIRERGEGVLEEIHEMAEEMIRESERKLSEKAKRVTDAKLEVLSGQVKSAQISLSLLEHIEDYVEQSVKTGTPQQVLRSKKQMMERMSEAAAHDYNVKELHPKEKADFSFFKDSKIAESLQHIGDIVTYSSTALQQCKVKKIIPNLHLSNREMSSFSMSIEAPDSSLLSVPISSLKCSLVPVDINYKPNETINATFTSNPRPGAYVMHCKAKGSRNTINTYMRGKYTVKVQVCGVQLEDALLFIPFNPYLDYLTSSCRHRSMNFPYGVAISDEYRVAVTEFKDDSLTIMDYSETDMSKKVRNVCVGVIKPRGVAITADNYVIVSNDDCIGKLRMNGSHIPVKAINYPGSARGVAISPISGQIYVAIWDRHSIIVFNSDLTFAHSFGSEGSGDGQFLFPFNIAIDNDGLVYVTDCNNHRVQKFTPDGQFIAWFGGGKGAGFGQLDKPSGIAIDNAGTGLVYVSEGGNSRISVFTRDGDFVRCFGGKGGSDEKFNNPLGMAFDKDGFLYICDSRNERIVIY